MYVNCLLYMSTYVHRHTGSSGSKSTIMPSKTRAKTRENRLTACMPCSHVIRLKHKYVKMSTSRYTYIDPVRYTNLYRTYCLKLKRADHMHTLAATALVHVFCL